MSDARRAATSRVTLRTRVVVAATAVVALALAAAGWALATALRQSLVDDVSLTAQLRSAELAALAATDELPDPVPVVDDDEDLVEVVRDGAVIGGSSNASDARLVDLPAPEPGVTRVVEVDALPLGDEDAGFLVAMTTVDSPGGRITVAVATSLEDVDESIATSTGIGSGTLGVLLAVIGGTIWVLVGRTLAPVESIRRQAETISGTDLHRRVPQPPVHDEIGRLAATLNSMLERLEDASDQQRRFIADAAHELRTPVASIRTALETARDAAAAPDWDAVSEGVLADATRMQLLIEQLLTVARLDAEAPRELFGPVDLDDVVADAIGRRPDTPGLDVVVARLRPQQVRGSRILLGQVVTNLLDNATAHAARRVEVWLDDHDGRAVLTVDDDGPGLPADHCTVVFERFVRLDEARSRLHDGGSGLGLAIVADIVAAHDGAVRADDSPLGGARFEVALPRLA